jgi:hypothetical protein
MRFRNAFLVFLENFKNTYKILLYKLIVAIVCIALYCVLILPEISAIFSSAEWLALKADGLALLSAFLPTGSAEQFETVKQSLLDSTLPAFAQMVVSQAMGIAVRAGLCVIVYLAQRFLDSMCYVAVGSVLNDRMSAYSDTPFSKSYLTNLSKSCKYSLVYVPLAFLFDAFAIAFSLSLMRFLSGVFAIYVCVTLVVFVQALKLTLTSQWMPAIVTDSLSTRGAMRSILKTDKKQNPKTFAANLASVYVIIIINVVAALCTAGSALLITVPASYLFLICLQFVNYYTVTGKKYFITYDNIAKTSSFGDAEDFFKLLEREEKEEKEV